jgi:exopolysaccharide production protein ExoQ
MSHRLAIPQSTGSFSGPFASEFELRTPAPVWNLVMGWVLLIPLFYIAANGTFILQAGEADPSAIGQGPGTDGLHKISVALVAIICVGLIALRSSQFFALARRSLLLLALPVLAFVSFSWSADPRQTMISAGILFIFVAFAIHAGERFPFERQFELLMLLGGVAVLLSIALALLVPSIGTSEAGWRGIFGHKQNCAVAAIIFLLTAIHWQPAGIWQRVFRGFFMAACVALVALSQSRTGWALALVMLALSLWFWLLQRMARRDAALLVLLAIPVAIVAICVVFAMSSTLLVAVGKDATLSQRTIIWSAAWISALKHPLLGYGFSAFWKGLYGPSQSITLIAGWGLHQAQNGFIDLMLALGGVGLLTLFLIVAQAMWRAVQHFYSPEHGSYVRWCILMIVCTLLYNIGESTIAFTSLNWFVFLLAVVGLTQIHAYEMSRHSAAHLSWARSERQFGEIYV